MDYYIESRKSRGKIKKCEMSPESYVVQGSPALNVVPGGVRNEKAYCPKREHIDA